MISLYPEQQAHADNLLRALCENRVAVDKSKTGTGKTFVASWIAAQLGRPVGVVSPIAVLPVWERTLRLAGLHPQFIVNYEKLRTGNTPFGKFNFKKWEWDASISKDTVIIFDEFHRCKGINTLNARIAQGSKPYIPLLLSATLARDPTEMRALGYLTNLHQWVNHYKWCLRNNCWKAPFGGLHFKTSGAEKTLLALNSYLFPKYGGGLSRADLGDAFKQNTIIVEALAMNDGGKIQRAYNEMEKMLAQALVDADGEALPASALTFDLKLRQEIEMLKVPSFAAQAEDLVEEGNSVVIGTNFRESLFALCEKLGCPGIYGGQDPAERERIIQLFQTDKIRRIVVNIQAGGVGISLHDLLGQYPRVSLISPPNSAVDLIQFLGRIDRAGAQSDSLQKIIYAAGTNEEQTCARVQLYADRIELLSDGILAVDFSGNTIAKKNKNTACTDLTTPLSSDRASPPGPVADKMETETHVTSAPPVLDNGAAPEPGDYANAPSIPSTGAIGDVVVTATLVHATRAHARLAPSKLRYTAICAGFENDPTGDKKAADRGSLGHLAVEKENLSLCGEDFALKAAAQKCLEYQYRLMKRAALTGPPVLFKETRLDYFEQFGFTDVIILENEEVSPRCADLVDWKFAWNFHKADSPQFWAYCVGLWNRWEDVEQITVHTVHPFRGDVDIEVFNRTEHYSLFSGMIAAIMEKADARRPGDFRISEICAYCGFAGKCVKLAAMGQELAARYAGPEIYLPEGSLHGSEITDPDVFAALLRAKPIVEKAAKSWSHGAMYLYNQGTDIPGFKLRKSGGKRTVSSATAAFDILRLHFVPTMTSAQMLEYCTVSATELDTIVEDATPKGKKAKAVEQLAAHLEDADILTQGTGGSYLAAIKL